MKKQKVKFKDQFRDPKIDKKSSVKFNMNKFNKNMDSSKRDTNGFIPRMIHTESFDEQNEKSSPSEEDAKGISSFINKNKYIIGISIIVIIVIIVAIFLWYNYRKKNKLISDKNIEKIDNVIPASNQEYYENTEYDQNKSRENNKNKTVTKNNRFSDSESDIELRQKNTSYNKLSNKQPNKQHIINNKLNNKNNPQNRNTQNDNTTIKPQKRKDILEKTKENLTIVSKDYTKLDDDNELTVKSDNSQKIIENQKKANLNLILDEEDNNSEENEIVNKKRTNVLMFSNDESDNEEFYKPQ
jgi:hypothetical protein